MSSTTPAGNIVTREPALWLAVISAGVSLLVTFRWDSLSPEHGALWIAAITALFGVAAAVMTRPLAPVAFTTLVTVGFALAAGYHFEADPATIAQVNILVLAVLSLLSRAQISPVPVSRPAAPQRVSRRDADR